MLSAGTHQSANTLLGETAGEAFFYEAEMRTTYAEKLKDPRWQKLRLIALEEADWTCTVCGDKESPLHVHHNWYLSKKEPWDYGLHQLSVVCDTCHQRCHVVMSIVQEALSNVQVSGPENMEALMWFLAGMNSWTGQDIEPTHGWQKKCYDIGRKFDSLG